MKLKLKIHSIKKKILEVVWFITKPLDTALERRKTNKYKKQKEYARNMSFEEIVRRYVKLKINSMVKSNRKECTFELCNKIFDEYDEYGGFILSDLLSTWCSLIRKDKYLRVLYYSNPLFKELSRDRDKWIAVEHELHALAKLEFERKGCKTEYIDNSKQYSDYFVKRSEYVKTLKVSL